MKNRIGGISVWRIVMGMCLLLAVGDAMAEVNPSRISLYGRNYAGRVLNANVARQTNWYMSYDVAVGFSTRSLQAPVSSNLLYYYSITADTLH